MTENPSGTTELDLDDLFAGVSEDSELVTFDKVGKIATGVLLDIEKKPGKYKNGEAFPWLTLDTAEGVRKVAASSWDMQRKLLAAIKASGGKIQLGSSISIEYIGDKVLGNGNTAKEYAVTYEPPVGA